MYIKDLSDEFIECLKYVEHSDDKTAEESTGVLVKNIHKRVVKGKNNLNVEGEVMTLLEGHREKLEEGIVSLLKKYLIRKIRDLIGVGYEYKNYYDFSRV